MTQEHPEWRREGRDWPNREASRFARVGATAWHYQRMGPRIGGGPVALLLHGAGASTHSWRDLMPELAGALDVVAPDLPGHGFTRAPGAHSLPAMAARLAELVRALEIRPALVVAHSAGAAIGLRMALDGVIAPAAIVGINAALKPFGGLAGAIFPPLAKVLALNPLTPWAFAHLSRWGDTRRLIESTGSRIDARGIELYARLLARPDHVAGALSMMASWDLPPLLADLPRLTVPLHLVVSPDDGSVSPAEARQLAARYGFIRLHEMAGGHIVHEARPAEVAGLILRIAAEEGAFASLDEGELSAMPDGSRSPGQAGR